MFIGAAWSRPAEASKLKKMVREARKSSSSNNKSSQRRSRASRTNYGARAVCPNRYYFSDCDRSGLGALTPGVLVLFAPWTLPMAFTKTLQRPIFWYASHPYAADSRSALIFAPTPSPEDQPPPQTKPPSNGVRSSPPRKSVAVQAMMDGYYGPFDAMYGAGAQLRLQTPTVIELDTRWIYLRENLSTPVTAIRGQNHVTIRFAHDEQVQFRTGIGSRHYIVEGEHILGFDGFYGIEIFLGQPFRLALELHLGNLGQALTGQGRGELGIFMGPLEIYGGLDYLRIGSEGLGLVFSGLRLWL